MIGFDPTAFTLQPGEQRVVEARFAPDHLFEPGETYTTTLRVDGFPGREVRLAVSVLEDNAKAETTAANPGEQAVHSEAGPIALCPPWLTPGAVPGCGASL